MRRDIKVSLNLSREELGMVQYIMKQLRIANRNEAIRYAIRRTYVELLNSAGKVELP